MLQMLADIRPNEEHAKEHIERNPVTTVAQVVPEMSEHEVRSCLASRLLTIHCVSNGITRSLSFATIKLADIKPSEPLNSCTHCCFRLTQQLWSLPQKQ